MLVFRSFALGLLGACCLLLAMRPPLTVMTRAPGQILIVSSPTQLVCPVPATTEAAVTVVDVASGVTSGVLAQMIVLAANERIAAIDDVPVANGSLALAHLALRSRQYVDIAVVNDANVSRRVLVLLR